MVLPKKSLLLERWIELLRDSGTDELHVAEAVAEIEKCYEQPWRRYHTLAHIGLTLTTLDRLERHARGRRALEFAVWLHDAVYRPQLPFNELRSAWLASRLLRHTGLPRAEIARVARLILVTRDHVAPEGDLDAQVIVDCDLAVLGEEPSIYAWYRDELRAEYGFLSYASYAFLRRRKVEKLLRRDWIYCTPRMRAEREEQARENLMRELGVVGRLPYPSRAA